MKVISVRVTVSPNRLHTREDVHVVARGDPAHLARYWARLDDIDGASGLPRRKRHWWLPDFLDWLSP